MVAGGRPAGERERVPRRRRGARRAGALPRCAVTTQDQSQT